jgi:hypothetical protein
MAVPWRHSNERAHISGVLLFTDAHFLGILEGHEQDLERLWLRLRADQRHRDLIRIGDDRCGQRWFPEWGMAYTEHAVVGAQIETLRTAQAPPLSKWARTIRPILQRASAYSTLASYQAITRSGSYLALAGRRRSNSFLTTS